jgi:hypothetical protein
MKKNKDLKSIPMHITYFEIKETDPLENTDIKTYPLMCWHIFLSNFFHRIGISILVSDGGFRAVKQLLVKLKNDPPLRTHEQNKGSTNPPASHPSSTKLIRPGKPLSKTRGKGI